MVHRKVFIQVLKYRKLKGAPSRRSSIRKYGSKRKRQPWFHNARSDIPRRETENNPYVLHTRNDVPLKSEFKPSVQVLSRKPAPKVLPRKDCTSGIEQLSIDDDEDEDEDESKKTALTLEERQQKAQREREEKQKKYEEVRERLFGSDKVSDTSSPGIITLPNNKSGGDTRYRGRSKGARDSRPSSSNGNKTRQLFEPNHNPKPDSIFVQKKETQSTSGRSTPAEVQIIRHPRGPDGSGRGGIGFARRGDKRGIT